MDLISRQAALDDLATFVLDEVWDEELWELNWRAFPEIICRKMVRLGYVKQTEEGYARLPTAEPQWTPCSERLPGESGRYLVTRGLNACGSLWNRIYIANYSDLMGIKSERIWWQGNVGKSDFERLDDVLAWMPLPEPYKEG